MKNQIKTPRPEFAECMAAEVTRRWQPLVKKRAHQQAAKRTGLVIETRARFGFTAAPGTTDDGRMRRITRSGDVLCHPKLIACHQTLRDNEGCTAR
ncbi:hypothetical protein J7E97_19040 [Streptomyces sp. ISL-66]|nr:hypothetical protein [Streptomyces sp. ISL-66]